LQDLFGKSQQNRYVLDKLILLLPLIK